MAQGMDRIAMALAGKPPQARDAPMVGEPDGDEPSGAMDMRSQVMDMLSGIDPSQLVELIATVAAEKPEVLAALQEEMGEPHRQGMAEAAHEPAMEGGY